jgi:hypothetical protein
MYNDYFTWFTQIYSSANHTGAILPISFAACELVAVKAVPKISLS